MKVLIIDTGGGVGLDMAMRARMAGHTERYFLMPGKFHNVGRGLVTRVEHWEPHMRWADLIVLTDNAKYHEDIEPFFKKGFPIFGTSPQAAQIELDRELGQRIFDAAGIETIPRRSFSSYDEAERFVIREQRRFVSKPKGDADRALSYCSKSPADLIYMIRHWAREDKLKGEFILQEFVDGIEMGVSGWFGPEGWVGPWEENFEHKKRSAGEKGVTTGEMGTAVLFVEESELAERVLKPLEQTLHTLEFVGNCDVNCIIDKRGRVWPLEFTVRLGWPDYFIQSVLQKGDPIEWMGDLLEGRWTRKVRMDHAIGVVVVIGDYPHSHITCKQVEGIPLYGLNERNMKQISLCDVMAGEAPDDKGKDYPCMVSAGDYLMCVTGMGSSVSEARDDCYGTIGQIEVPNSPDYRIDIGERLKEEIPALKKLGFAKGWRW